MTFTRNKYVHPLGPWKWITSTNGLASRWVWDGSGRGTNEGVAACLESQADNLEREALHWEDGAEPDNAFKHDKARKCREDAVALRKTAARKRQGDDSIQLW